MCPFLDLADDDAFPDLHREFIDRGCVRKGKDISAFKPFIGGVFKVLGDCRPGDQARDLDLNLGEKHWYGPKLIVFAGAHQQRAGLGILGRHGTAEVR